MFKKYLPFYQENGDNILLHNFADFISCRLVCICFGIGFFLLDTEDVDA